MEIVLSSDTIILINNFLNIQILKSDGIFHLKKFLPDGVIFIHNYEMDF